MSKTCKAIDSGLPFSRIINYYAHSCNVKSGKYMPQSF